MLKENLYNKYGGYQTIKTLTIDFYERVKKEKSLDHYFVNVNMDGLIEHQTKYLCQTLGGPAHYSGRELRKSHIDLKITEKDFNLVARLLQETLQAGGMAPEDIKIAMTIVASTKNDVVTPPTA